MVEPLYSSEKSTIFYDFSVKDRIVTHLRNKFNILLFIHLVVRKGIDHNNDNRK